MCMGKAILTNKRRQLSRRLGCNPEPINMMEQGWRFRKTTVRTTLNDLVNIRGVYPRVGIK